MISPLLKKSESLNLSETGGLFASSAHTHATPSQRMVFELVRECVAQRTLLVSGLGSLDKGMQRPPVVSGRLCNELVSVCRDACL